MRTGQRSGRRRAHLDRGEVEDLAVVLEIVARSEATDDVDRLVHAASPTLPWHVTES